MGNTKLSIIIPFCNEYPQVLFTLQMLINELRGQDAEILTVNNYCHEVGQQIDREEICPVCMNTIEYPRGEDLGGQTIDYWERDRYPAARKLEYKDKLSHWQAKNHGVSESTGGILLFLDAHVVPTPGAIKSMYNYFVNNDMGGTGHTLHLPLTQMGGNLPMTYKLETDPGRGYYHYQFTRFNDKNRRVVEVPVMSTCGMMISKQALQEELGGWPTELGIYGGGENFVNFTMSVLGHKKYMFNTGALYHLAAPRGYRFNYDDFIRNRGIAVYMFAGAKKTGDYIRNCQGNTDVLEKILSSIVDTKSNKFHRDHIKSRAIMDIDEWLEKQKTHGLWNGEISNRRWVS